MIVKIINSSTGLPEWCMIEFQGEIVGHSPGSDLGTMKINDVRKYYSP